MSDKQLTARSRSSSNLSPNPFDSSVIHSTPSLKRTSSFRTIPITAAPSYQGFVRNRVAQFQRASYRVSQTRTPVRKLSVDWPPSQPPRSPPREAPRSPDREAPRSPDREAPRSPARSPPK